MSEDRDFTFRGYWGSELMRPFVEYSKNGLHYCIYCGSIADTREHVPSKVFLNKPLPGDLPTLPACQKCNNGFSSDELYTNTYIECVKGLKENNNSEVIEIQPLDRKEVREAKNAAKQDCEKGIYAKDERIEHILIKLAKGHIVYELFECYNLDSFPVASISVNYVLKCSVDNKTWASLETIEPIDNEVFPEIGSRAFRNMYVLDVRYNSPDDSNGFVEHHLFMDWTDIQDGVYRYITLYNGDEIIVKMVIRDYLYAEATFKRQG